MLNKNKLIIYLYKDKKERKKGRMIKNNRIGKKYYKKMNLINNKKVS